MLTRIPILITILVTTFFLKIPVQASMETIIEDYNDQDIFNNFSGDWNRWSGGTGNFDISYDTINKIGDYGAGLKLSYSVPTGGYGGLWISLLGKVDCKYQYLIFTDLYRMAQNSDLGQTGRVLRKIPESRETDLSGRKTKNSKLARQRR